MELTELRKISARLGIPQGTVEKDYVISAVLREIAESGLKDSIIFKGGTALKKVYFADARFSEDIDFSVIGKDQTAVEALVRRMFDGKKFEGIEILKVEHERSQAGLRMALKFLGPIGHPQRIRLDFSFREKPAAAVKEERTIDSYGQSICSIKVLSLAEIMAEKIRAISSRSAPRDLYDIWYLTTKGVSIDSKLVAKKFSLYGEKFEKENVIKRLEEFKQKWKNDLQPFMAKVPPFESIADKVRHILI
jgi:predicted nucleotidyltransferase component of viral defense system